MTFGKKVGTSEVVPFERLHAEHCAELGSTERQERLESDCEVGRDLECEVEDGSHTTLIGLEELPRFGLGKILVTDACELHGLLLCVTELEVVEQ